MQSSNVKRATLPRWFAAVAVATIFAASLILPEQGNAYEAAGHFYGVGLVSGSIDPANLTPPLSNTDVFTITFCAWLPDETTELNAVEVYKWLLEKHPFDYGTWSAPYLNPWSTDSGYPDTIGKMVVIQQLLHGLTGGRSQAVRQVARSLVTEMEHQREANPHDPNSLCALGFSLHLLGDSYAHTRLDDPSLMYPTGRGHAPDYTWPDHPLHTLAREEDWEGYLDQMALLLAPARARGNILVQYAHDAKDYVEEHGSDRLYFVRDDGEQYLTNQSYQALKALYASNPPTPDFISEDTPQTCQQYMRRNQEKFRKNNTAPAFSFPDCKKSWALYQQHAARVFDSVPNSRDLGFGNYFQSQPPWGWAR